MADYTLEPITENEDKGQGYSLEPIDDKSALSRSAIIAHNVDSDKYAQNRKAMTDKGIPESFASPANKPPSMDGMLSTIKDFLGLSGKTAEHFKDPEFAKVAKDDHKELTNVEKCASFWNDFLLPTIKAIPKVVGSTAAQFALYPGTGVNALIDLSKGKTLEEAYKTMEETMAPYSDWLTKEEKQGLANVGLVMKLFEMAGEGWKDIAQLTPLKGTVAEPIAGTIGEASAMFGLPELFNTHLGKLVEAAKKIKSKGDPLVKDAIKDMTGDSTVQAPLTVVDDILTKAKTTPEEALTDPTAYYEQKFEGMTSDTPVKADLPMPDVATLSDNITPEHIKDMGVEGVPSVNEAEALKADTQPKTPPEGDNAVAGANSKEAEANKATPDQPPANVEGKQPLSEQTPDKTGDMFAEESPEETKTTIDQLKALNEDIGQSGKIDLTGMKDYIQKASKEVKYSGDLQKDYYTLKNRAEIDRILTKRLLEKAEGKPADYEAIYNWIENPKEKITERQKKIYRNEVEPIAKERNRLFSKLRNEGVPVEGSTYTPRFVAEKGGFFDRLIEGMRTSNAGAGMLRKTTGSFKKRTMRAIEREGGDDMPGERLVVSVKDGEVTAFKDGKPESMGKLKYSTPEEEMNKAVEPIDRQIKKLNAEKKTLTMTKSRIMGSVKRIENIGRKIAELEAKKQETMSSTFFGSDDLTEKSFVDKDGVKWKLGEATTKEIEANTKLKYHKNALLNEITTYNELKKVDRAIEYLDGLMNNPEFTKVAVKLGTQNIPDGYKTTILPQLRGYAFPDRIAETFDTFYKHASQGLMDPSNAYAAINTVLRNAIFFNPLIHSPNIINHWLVNRGVTDWLNPYDYPRLLRSSNRAIKAVLTMNDDYVQALDKGTSLLYSGVENKNLYELMLKKMGKELESNSPMLDSLGKALGYANPKTLVKRIYKFSSDVTWATNDIATLQAIYEEMEHGMTMDKAIEETGKHIPNYRIPPRVMNSTTISKLMKPDSGVTMFGAYHYGALKSYGEMIKTLVKPSSTLKERGAALDKLAMLGIITYVIYPQLDKIAQGIHDALGGNKEDKVGVRRAGASTFLYNTEQLAKDNIDFPEYVQSVLTPSIGLTVGMGAYMGRDPRTGKKLSPKEMALQAVAPVSQATRMERGERTPAEFAESLVGISKQYTDAERQIKKFLGLRMPQGDEETAAKSRMKRSIVDAFRKNKPLNKDQRNAYAKMTEAQKKNIDKESEMLPIQVAFSHLTPDEAKVVWNKMSNKEKMQCGEIYEKKIETAANKE